MLKAGAGLSREPSAERAARQAGESAMLQGGLTSADLVIAFATTHYSHEYTSLLSTLRSVTGAKQIVGCSGMGVLASEEEVESSISLAVLALEGISAVPFLVMADEKAPQGIVDEILERIPKNTGPSSTLMLLTDALHVNAPFLLQALQERLRGISIVGGTASGMSIPPRTFQWLGDEITDRGIVGVLFPEEYPTQIGVAQGCQPIGMSYIITKARENVILEIGNRPASEMLQQALQSLSPEAIQRASGSIFAGLVIDEHKYPLERGDFLVRNLVGLDEKYGAIAVDEQVSVGQTIQFQLRDAQAARTDLRETLAQLSERVGQTPPSFGLYFNCLGRGQGLFGQRNHDTGVISELFPDVPVVGFFGNAEFAPVQKRNVVHNYTGVPALFGAGTEAQPA